MTLHVKDAYNSLQQLCWHKWSKSKMSIKEGSQHDPWGCFYDPDNYQDCMKCGERRIRPGSEIDGIGSRP